ncbi:MAG TPA: [protein-PII] uridylyltransferase [Candidatus Binataceae bacterium]
MSIDSVSDQPALDALVARGAIPDEDGLFEEIQATRGAGPIARSYIEAVRDGLKQQHLAGASGSEIVFALTAATDRLVRALYRYAEAEHNRRFPRLNARIAVVARGGYGRGELNPYSDIDLLFLHEAKRSPHTEVVAETILYGLFDSGFVIGQTTRNVRECSRLTQVKLEEMTALLDARFLAGDQKLFADLEKAIAGGATDRNRRAFFKAKLQESVERHSKYGDSIYLLEPEIKQGEGGLRDLHTAMWLAKMKYRAHSLEELVQKAVLREAEVKVVQLARDFLWRVRNSMHFLSGREDDRLTFENQEKIAPIMGFKAGADQGTASAKLMEAYYANATTIYQFAEDLIARVTEESERVSAFRFGFGREIRSGVIIQRKHLGIADPQLFVKDSLNLVTIFADCQAHNVTLSSKAYQIVRESLHLIDDQFRTDPRTGAALMSILKGRSGVATTLEAMHRTGVLGAIIPEFGKLNARVIQDLYHIYTVDRHSLVAVREMERLRAGEFKSSNQLLTDVSRELDSVPLVLLALLLHDIGKGHGHDHDARGALLTEEVSARLGLSEEETELVVFLVRNHLLMSQVAQKGDLDDETMVGEFVRTVGSIERMKALYLLTFADMRAVAPKVYNNWRDMLLGDLYFRALKRLEQGDREAVDPERRVAEMKQEVSVRLSEANATPAAIAHFLEPMPDRYFLTMPEDDIALHFQLITNLGDQLFATRHRHFTDREYTEYIVVTRDQPGLFSKIAAALTANGLSILSGRITTRLDGIVLDIFRISHQANASAMALEEERWERVDQDLERVISGAQDAEQLVAKMLAEQLRGKHFAARVATEVTIDNRLSDEFTVVDVFTQDRIGLLFAITNTLFRLGLHIHLARISTNAFQALDVFYVTDASGNKITDLRKLRELRDELTMRLEPQQEQPAA